MVHDTCSLCRPELAGELEGPVATMRRTAGFYREGNVKLATYTITTWPKELRHVHRPRVIGNLDAVNLRLLGPAFTRCNPTAGGNLRKGGRKEWKAGV